MTKDTEHTAANMDGTLETVRFGALAIAPENVRAKDQSDSPAEIAELAESIYARGLLKNLVGYRHGDLVNITAGRRRWKALAWLVSEDGGHRIDSDYPVTVLIRDRENAIADSLAENTGHKTMTAAQEIAAYRALAKEGKTDAEIARTHGTAVQRVKMLLRLASVAPMILKAFEAEEITLEALKAFASRDDQKRQRAVFKAMTEQGHRWSPWSIRSEMLQDTLEADNPVAVFVGADAYREAGGRFDVDLFTKDQDAAWLDVDLAKRLAREKIDAEAEALREAEGWQWARAELDTDFYVEGHVYARVYPESPGWEEPDIKRCEELEMILDDDPKNVEALAEWDALEAKYADVYPAQAKEIGGFVLALNDEGGLTIERGLIRAEDAPKKIEKDEDAPKFRYVNPNAPSKGRGKGGGENPRSGAESATDGDKPHYTAKHRDRLTPIRRAAFQEALAGCPALAFDLTAFDMARSVADQYSFDRTPLNVTARNQTGTHPGYDYNEETPFYDGFLAVQDGLPSEWLGGDEDEKASIEDQFAAFRAMPKADKERWLAFAVAASAEIAVTDERGKLRSSERFAEHIAQEAKADIRKGWTPDGAFFRLYRKEILLEILADLLGGDECDDYTRAAKQPKGALADEIGQMFTCEITREALTKEVRKRVDAWRPLGTAFDGAQEPQEGEDA